MLEDIMEELLTLLSHIKEDVDFKNSVNLVEDGVLDSLEIVAIIDGVEKTFKISLDPDDIDPSNFRSATAMWNMIEKHLA